MKILFIDELSKPLNKKHEKLLRKLVDIGYGFEHKQTKFRKDWMKKYLCMFPSQKSGINL